MSPIINKGTILLAEPFMLDGNFKRSAILLVEHNPQGSLGFIMNTPVSMQVNDLVADFPEFEAPVNYGGPVGTDTIHYLHRRGDLIGGSQLVTNGIYWGGNYEQTKALIAQGIIQARDIRFFVGYSGWSEDQLAEELEGGSWVTAPMHPNYLFKSRPEKLWSQVMDHKGNAFSVIARMSEEPNYN